jgi:uncharacterized membrane protein YphA (DoxX/SURF4 family)
MNRRGVWLWVGRIARLVLGGLFLYAGLVKGIGLDLSGDTVHYAGPTLFRTEIANYRLGAVYWLIHPAAIVLPWIEVAAGLTLIIGLWVPASAALICAMLIVFNAMVGSAMYRNLDIECGCFGTNMRVGWLKILENLGLFALGLVAILAHVKARRPSPAPAAEPSPVANRPAAEGA